MSFKINVLYFFIFLYVIVPSSSYSKEFSLQPRITLGYMSYDFQDTTSSFNKLNLKDAQPYFGLGSTLTHKNYYVDLYWQQSGKFSDSMTNKTNDTHETNDTTIYNSIFSKKIGSGFDQNNLSITLGCISNRVTYFAGFKLSKTNFDMNENEEQETRYRENELEPYYDKTTKFEYDSMDYDNRSLFIGCGYSIPIKKYGTLGGKIAISYSKMDTIRTFTVSSPAIDEIDTNDETNQNENNGEENNGEENNDELDIDDIARIEAADRTYTIKQSASKDNVFGYSIGIVWNAPISKYWKYNLSLQTAQYKSDDVEDIQYQLSASIIWVIPFKASLNF